MRRTVALLALAGSVLARTASADPIPLIIHDFDDRPPGLQGYFDEQYLNLFSFHQAGGAATWIEIAASPYATSAPNVVKGAHPGWGVLGNFMTDEYPRRTLATQLLFLDITGPTDAASPWRLSIFDRNGALIESHMGRIPVGIGFARGGAPSIASFLFEPGVLSQGLDNVRYETPVVPEPATMLLVGSGLAAAVWRRRRRAAPLAG
jgi:hypothetical protein